MPEDLSLLLLIVAISLPLGLIVGWGVRRRYPNACGRWGAFAGSMPWWWYAGFALFFTQHALGQAYSGRWAFATFFAGCALAQLIAALCRVRQRAKSQSPDGLH